jgi:WG containing repeat
MPGYTNPNKFTMKYILYITALLFSASLSAQQIDQDVKAEDTRTEEERFRESIPSRKKNGKPQIHKYNDLWGYILNDSILIPFKYYDLELKYNDLMIAREPRMLTGVINKKGETVIPFEYITLQKCADDIMFGHKQHAGYGLMTASGKILVPFEYESGVRIDSVFVFSSKGKQLIINYLGANTTKVVLEGDYDEISIMHTQKRPILQVKQNGLWGIMNYQKQMLVPCQYESIEAIFQEYAFVKKSGKVGVVNFSNQIIIPFEYDRCAGRLKNGLFSIGVKDAKGGYKYSLIDSTGRVLLPAEYQQIEQFYYIDLIKVKKDEKYAIVDPTGKMLTPLQFNSIGEWKHQETTAVQQSSGFAKIESKEAYGKYFVYKYTESPLIGLWHIEKGAILPTEFDYFEIFDREGIIKVSINDKNAIYSMEGKQLVNFDYGILSFNPQYPDFVSSTNNNARTIVSIKEGKPTQPEYYDDWFMYATNKMYGFFYTKKGIALALHAPDGRRITEHQYIAIFSCPDTPEITQKLPPNRKAIAVAHREINGLFRKVMLDDLGTEYLLD